MRDMIHRRRVVVAVGAVLAVATAVSQRASAQDGDGLAAALALEEAFTRAIAGAEESVVSISRVKVARPALDVPEFNPFRIQPQGADSSKPASPDYVPAEFGTGFIIAPARNRNERFILTNYHVVRGGPAVGQTGTQAEYELFVRLADRRGYDAQIVAADPRSDLAVLKIDSAALGVKPADLKPLPIDGDFEFKKGQFVLALGNPYAIARDGSASASWGFISNISRSPARPGAPYEEEARRKETIHHFGTLLQVDTRLNLGTSGGPLLNLKGELIGITTSLAALDGYEKSVGYAIPVDARFRRIIDDLTSGHEVEYGFLGVQPVDVSHREMEAEPGRFSQVTAARAMEVFPNSPAAEAGLQSLDIVLAVNGEPVLGRYDLMRLVGQLGPDTIARLKVWRERAGRELILNVKLGKWPVYDDEGIITTNPRYPDWRGMAVDFPTGRQKHLQLPFRYHPAVVVTKLPSQSNIAAGELQVGDFITHVNRTAVQTPEQFHRAATGQEGDVTLRLLDGRRVVVRK